MKTLQIYEAKDGSRHDEPMDALARESLIDEVNRAMAPLGPEPKLNNGEWWQHDASAYRSAHRAIVFLSIPYTKGYENLRAACINEPDTINPLGFMGRLMCEVGGPLSRAWQRLSCISDTTFREADQPYFTLHPNELKGRVGP